MADQKSKNPYMAFIDKEDEKPELPSPAQVTEPEVQKEETQPLTTAGAENPYDKFLDTEEKKAIDQRVIDEAKIGAGVFGTYGFLRRPPQPTASLAGVDMNAPMSASGMQAYLNSQINPKYQVKLKDLEKLTGKDIRTMSEAQEALRFLQGQESERIAKTITDPYGRKRQIFHTVAGREPVSLAPYEQTLGKRIVQSITPTASGVASRSLSGAKTALAGAAGVPMATQMIRQTEPIEWQQWASLAGSGLGMTRSGPLQALGLALQAPYIAKHGQEIAESMDLADINPTAFTGGLDSFQTIKELTKPAPSKAGAGRGFVNPPLSNP